MNENHEFVNRRVWTKDGDATGKILAVNVHEPSGKVIGVRVKWDVGIKTPDGVLWETNVFWSRVELLPAN